MEYWLSSRLQKYNGEVNARVASVLAVPGAPKLETLKAKLHHLFPQPDPASQNPADWLNLDGPSEVGELVLEWIVESAPGEFFCPQHALSREALLGLLQRSGRWIEVDVANRRARLAPSALSSVPPPPVKAPVFVRASLQAAAPALQGLVTVVQPPPPPPPAAGMEISLPENGASDASQAPQADNLIDFLMNEALSALSPDMRARVQKTGRAVYNVASKEVTLHTIQGRLYVYRIGDAIRHMKSEAS